MTQRSLFDAIETDRTKAIRPNKSVEPQDVARLSKQAATILARLRQRPVTTGELSVIAKQYNARIYEIRKAGFDVQCERGEGGLNYYRLTENQ